MGGNSHSKSPKREHIEQPANPINGQAQQYPILIPNNPISGQSSYSSSLIKSNEKLGQQKGENLSPLRAVNTGGRPITGSVEPKALINQPSKVPQ
ncbi:hypothetical protein FGO68_gene11467 [Halteria grandinella]|uniref:Uncharacterized protein n=1 Tax=Halteria grandinella TaxID=5974 RepID=A0A8J8NBA7_HALGN|nr:hypothetical protein FGO68_gene11467 [Halteria grandinella]